MNIKEAKQQILNAIQAYLIKDEFGDYRISIEHQRPVFLLGAPGIGKTAIMEQIAQETGVNLVTYSMSHHTRESALGLPVIVPTVGGVADLVDDGVNGYKIDVQQLEDIKMRIISILTDDEIYASLSRNAIALSKKYSYANTIDSIEKTIIG